MILIDSSVWIELFRRHGRVQPRDLPPPEEWVTCLPVVQEVLQGFRDESAYRLARESMLAMPMVENPLAQDVHLQAADLYRAGRRAGLTIRSGVDCLIAACALRHDLPVLHLDRDFDRLARVCPLRTLTLES